MSDIPHYRESVHVRPIMELVDDLRLCGSGRDHEDCLRMDEAASWPVPAPWHLLDFEHSDWIMQ